MQINVTPGLGPQYAARNATPALQAGWSFARHLSAAEEATAELPAAISDEQIDFTGATRKELFDWMNSQILSGKMSLEESAPFLGMTLRFDPRTNQLVDLETDQTRFNFMEIARTGIEWAESRFDDQDAERWRVALETMRQSQDRMV